MRRSTVSGAIAVAALLGGGIAIALGYARRYGAVRVVNEEFDAASTLEVDVLGAVSVVAGEVKKISVQLSIWGSAATVAAYRLGVEREGQTLRLSAPGRMSGSERAIVRLQIVVPRATHLRVRSSAGAISARSLDDVDLDARLGAISASDVGGTVRVRIGAGAIAVGLAKDRPIAAVDIDCGAGPIALAVPRALRADYHVVARLLPIRPPDSVPGGIPVDVHTGAGPVAIALR
ncbi:MAG: hypothetical protein ABSD03_00040 [Vulcanimicrobiaceae bacterium]|jgi:hypothetical protein